MKRTPVLMGGALLCTSLLMAAAGPPQNSTVPTAKHDRAEAMKLGYTAPQQASNANPRDVKKLNREISGSGEKFEGGIAGLITCDPVDTLFGQDPSTPTDGWTFGVADSDWSPAGQTGLQRWDDFSGATGPICSVTWWGIRAFFDGVGFVECTEDPMQFTITFHPDNAGVPGAAVCTYVVSVSGTPTGQLFAGFEMHQYTVDLTGMGCCNLTDGWVSIQGGGDDPNCWLLWGSAGAGAGAGSSLADMGDGAGIITEDFDLAVCLGGTPTPGACCAADGTCTDGVDGADCLACGDIFYPGELCADVPACSPYIAACCLPDDSCAMLAPVDCEAMGGETFCNGETCADVNCLEPACGVDGTGSCFEANGTPFCDGLECCELICAGDPFCCDTEWDGLCATAALEQCDGAPTGACCDDDAGCTDGLTQFECESAGGTYQGNDSFCSDVTCTGSCCLGDGTCVDASLNDCAAQGGTFGGIGSLCADAVCTGACCQGDGTCTDGSPDDCAASGGVFQGLGTLCADITCPFGACCLDGICIEDLAQNCANAGGTYLGDGTSCIDFDCTPPANDTCLTAEPLLLGDSAIGNNTLADDDATPFCGTSSPFNGMWYSVVGTGNTMLASTCNPGSDFDTKIQVFCDCLDLVCVGGNDDAVGAPPECDLNGLNRFSQVFWCSTPGQIYYIKVGGFGSSTGTFELTVTDDGVACDPAVSCEPPVGRCCYAEVCQWDCGDGDGNVGTVDLLALLAQWNGPGACDFDGGGVGVTDLLKLLAAWGACPDGAPQCADTTLGECDALGGVWDETLDCTTDCPVPLDNDTCATCTVITDADLPFSVSQDTSTAQNEGGPEGSCNSGGAVGMDNDIWYCYTPAADCIVTVSFNTPPYDALMAIYSGPDCDNLTEFDCLDTPDDPGMATFNAVAGETYWFQIGDWGTADGGGLTDFSLNCTETVPMGACCTGGGLCEILTNADCTAAGGDYQGDDTSCDPNPCPQPPANDECTGAIDIGEGTVTYNSSLATDSDTSDLDTICDEGFGLSLGKDVWYRYTPTMDGMATISFCASTYDSRMAAYSDVCPPTNLEILGCDDDACGVIGGPSELIIPVTTGTPVLIRAGGWASAPGAVAASGDGQIDITVTP